MASNQEKDAIIDSRCWVYAKANGACVICWPKQPKNLWHSCPSDVDATINNNPSFWEYYVATADGHIKHNFNTDGGVINGTSIKYHSLTFQTQQQTYHVEQAIAVVQPSDVISLDFRPLSVNVLIQKEAMENDETSWIYGSLNGKETEEGFIIPICYSEGSSNKWKQYTVHSLSSAPCKAEMHEYLSLKLGFTTTIHKAQGKMLKKVILALEERPSGMPQLLGIEDLFHVYFSCFCVDASVTCSDVRGAYILIAL